MNASIVELARAYRSIRCPWAKISKKFGLGRRDIQRALRIRAAALDAQSALLFSKPPAFQTATGRDL